MASSATLAIAAMALAAVLAATGARAQLAFTDVSDAAGVGQPSTLNESVAWGDFDGDGDPDLYLTNNGANVLLRNDGIDAMDLPVFTDVSIGSGVDHPGFSVGAAFGDLDGDGDLDLYVVSFSIGPDALLRNDTPQQAAAESARDELLRTIEPTFVNVTAAAGISDESSSRGVALVDYDHDGRLDIYVNAIGPDLLYRNLGNLSFVNVAAEAGTDLSSGQGVGVVATDIDDDGRIDLFTGNRSNDPNRLFHNRGADMLGATIFEDRSSASGITEVGLGMGVCALDIDNDLDSDLYWTSWPGAGASPQPNALYRNLGHVDAVPIFDEIAADSGTQDPLGWGISCNVADVDNDSFEDLAITNGFDLTSTKNVLFHNQGTDGLGDVTFTDATTSLAGGGLFDGRGVAFADYDLDGDVDLVITGGPSAETRLWRNDSVNANSWLGIILEGTVSNRSAIGARLWIESDLKTVMRDVSGGAGRGSQNDLPIEVGLGAASTVRSIRVRWPSERVSVTTDLATDQRLEIRESLIFNNAFERADASGWSEIVTVGSQPITGSSSR